jgi:hypothetical protein
VAPVIALECGRPAPMRNVFRGCHRYDQSALNVLLANHFDFNATKYVNQLRTGLAQITRHPTMLYEMQKCKKQSRNDRHH